MKKALLLICIFGSLATLSKAQRQFEIKILKDSIVGKPGGSLKNPAVIKDGETISYFIQVENEGTITGGKDTFPGGDCKINIFNWKTPDNSIHTPTYSLTAHIGVMAYKANCSFQTATLKIDKKDFKKPDSTNIVIIWPNGEKIVGLKDSMDDSIPNNFGFVAVVFDKAGIDVPESPKNFSIYPNPVKDVINIALNTMGKGTVSISDISGKVIATKAFGEDSGKNISVPLKEGTSDGVYLITVETPNYKEVSKIVVNK